MATTYGIHAARRRLRAMGGDLVRLAPYRCVPRTGRGYWVGQYRIELPGLKPHVVDEYVARLLSCESMPTLEEVTRLMAANDL